MVIIKVNKAQYNAINIVITLTLLVFIIYINYITKDIDSKERGYNDFFDYFEE